MQNVESLLITDLRDRYRSGHDTPARVMQGLLANFGAADPYNVWITRLAPEQVMAYVAALDRDAIEELPLYGIPFVIKDNIDLAGVPTTAACPDFAYTPTESAVVVQKLMAAGAIPLGKTNLDQFATGLVGARSPYGACRNSINPQFISGGSSSGSAVAVARGLASFSLGTDTAGSGRVPAAFNNLIGMKPSNGRISTRGVVPACRSLDCVSIFALTAEDARRVLDVAQGFDATDAFSQRMSDQGLTGLRIGVPQTEQLQFFGDRDYQRLFDVAVKRIETLGGATVTVDFAPFLAAARLLYDGPWIAERYAAVGGFLDSHPTALHPITQQIVASGKPITATAAYEGSYALRRLKRESESAWSQMDLLITPTVGTIYELGEISAEPIQRNANLGYYTNFMNLFDLCGVAVPAGFRADGLPFGITLVGPRAADRALLKIAGRLQRASVQTIGALGLPLPADPSPAPRLEEGYVNMAVCGAHMDGLPLNHQLLERGGYLLEVTRTAAHYRLFALPGGPPRRPGLIRVTQDGQVIELELWALAAEHVGSFIAGIPAPLGVGKIELESGAWVTGFICEGYAAQNAADISSYGGWRDYIKAASL